MIGDATALASSPEENMPRVQWSSVVTGTMNDIDGEDHGVPGPTIIPISEAATIHQRFSKSARL